MRSRSRARRAPEPTALGRSSTHVRNTKHESFAPPTSASRTSRRVSSHAQGLRCWRASLRRSARQPEHSVRSTERHPLNRQWAIYTLTERRPLDGLGSRDGALSRDRPPRSPPASNGCPDQGHCPRVTRRCNWQSLEKNGPVQQECVPARKPADRALKPTSSLRRTRRRHEAVPSQTRITRGRVPTSGWTSLASLVWRAAQSPV